MMCTKDPKRCDGALLVLHKAYGCTVEPSHPEYLSTLSVVVGEVRDAADATAN